MSSHMRNELRFKVEIKSVQNANLDRIVQLLSYWMPPASPKLISSQNLRHTQNRTHKKKLCKLVENWTPVDGCPAAPTPH